MTTILRILITAAGIGAGSLLAYAVEPGAPAGVTSVKFQHDYNGEAVIGITFKAPNETYYGNALTQISDLKVYRGEALLKTFFKPTPGEELSITDTTPEKKEYTYRFVASNESGTGDEVEEYVYVGADYAAPATNIRFRENPGKPGTAIISWDAPTQYSEGSPINPSLVSYEILGADGVTSVKAGIEGTSTEIEICNPSERSLANFFVISVTERGANYTRYAMTPLLALGEAYATDYLESFNGATPSTVSGGLNDFLRGSWSYVSSVDSPAMTPFDNDGGMATYKPKKATNETAWYSGKIAMPANSNGAEWSFRYFGVTGSTTTLQPFVYVDGDIIYDTIFKLGDNGEGWQQYSYGLDDYAGRNIQVGVKIVAGDKKNVGIDHIYVSGGESAKVGIADFSIPSKVYLNTPIPVKAVSVNNDKESHTIVLGITKDGESIYNKTQTLNAGETDITEISDIAPETSCNIDYTVTLSYIEDNGDITPVATSSTSVYVADKGYPAPKNVTIDKTGIMSWEEPDYQGFKTSEAVADNIESYESFAIDNAGDWKFVDADAVIETYGFTDFKFPNMGKPMSFIVFDSAGMNDTFAATSGTKYLASFSSPYGANDNWLISPDLPGSQNTLKFKAKSYSGQDQETFEVLYSTTTDATADFTLLATEHNISNTWTEYTYQLPAGSNYFAIRSTSDDKFFIEIDDIEYTRGVGNLSLTGYDVYRNFEKITSVEPTTRSCQLSDIESNDRVQVKAVYTRGDSDFSVDAKRVDIGAINEINTGNIIEVGRYNTAGLMVNSDAKGIVFIKYSNGSVRKVIIK